MIYEQLNNTANKNLSGKIKKVIRFVQENDLKQFGPGSHVIDGDSLFVNILSYETTAPKTGSGKRTRSISTSMCRSKKKNRSTLLFSRICR